MRTAPTFNCICFDHSTIARKLEPKFAIQVLARYLIDAVRKRALSSGTKVQSITRHRLQNTLIFHTITYQYAHNSKPSPRTADTQTAHPPRS